MTVGNHWQAAVAQGLDRRFGPTEPKEGEPSGSKFMAGVDTQGLQPDFYRGMVRLLPRPETEPLLGDRCIRADLWLSPGEAYPPLVAAP